MPMWCVAPLEVNERDSLGQGYNLPTGCSAEKPHMRHLTLTGFCTKELFFIDLLGTLLKQSHYRSWQAQRVPGE